MIKVQLLLTKSIEFITSLSVLLSKALESAKLNELVEILPKGLNTAVGENGIKLSGGQRQRIAIARAIYKGGNILILDEATSALDINTENSIMEFINKLNRENSKKLKVLGNIFLKISLLNISEFNVIKKA